MMKTKALPSEKSLEFPELKNLLETYMSTSLGKEKSQKIHPLKEKKIILQCLHQTKEAQNLVERDMAFSFAGVHDFRPFIEKARSQGTVLEPFELLDIADTLQQAQSISQFLKNLQKQSYPRLGQLAIHLQDLSFIYKLIYQSISSEETILDEASFQLSKIRKEKASLEKKIQNLFKKTLTNPNLKKALQSDLPTLRGDRMCLAVKSGYRKYVRGMILDSSKTGQTLFIEPEAVLPLGNRLAELRYSERHEINRILRKLTSLVLDSKEDLFHTLETLGWLDFTQGKAKMSIDFQMEIPEIKEEGALKLVRARHPLLLSLFQKTFSSSKELFEKVIPFDLTLGEEPSILIVTGPNTGGKTIILKATGLLVLMAHSGLPIPAGSTSSIPIYDKIHASIGDEQSLFDSLSTFSANIQKIIKILQSATASSLILIDEFGAGTDPIEAGALGEGILNQISNLKSHALITTHLSFLKKYAYQNPSAINGSVEFDGNTLKPTYRLLVGVPGNSKALVIAKRLGMSEKIIEDARKILNQGEDNIWIDRLQEAVSSAESNKEKIYQLKEDTKKIRDQMFQEQKILQQKQSILEQEMEIELEDFRREILQKIEGFMKPLQNVPKQTKEKLLDLQKFLNNSLCSTKLGEKRRFYTQKLKKRKEVFVISLGKSGIITRINKARQEVKVKIGTFEILTNFSDVSWIGDFSYYHDWQEKELSKRLEPKGVS